VGRWIEPFCGSCVVAFNIRPDQAILSDTNEHIIRFYADLQTKSLTSAMIRAYLEEQGSRLREGGENVYYEIRDAFNEAPTSLAFLFLNRACFNGVMRFNRKGGFNVPFCRKPDRFSRAYVTKIVNQVKSCCAVLRNVEWTFRVADFREALNAVEYRDLVYADPPYAGRHVDYFNAWSDADEEALASRLVALRCNFVLSTWYGNRFRTNGALGSRWGGSRYSIHTVNHHYHVGSTEDLRHPMTEALITNHPSVLTAAKVQAI
jgi:DNA adenine methylase